jgi:hypothetical protein
MLFVHLGTLMTTFLPAKDKHSNLDDLRNQLTTHLIALGLVCSVVSLWPLLWLSLDGIRFAISVALLLLSLSSWRLMQEHPLFARRLFIWGLFLCLLVACWFFSLPWLPYLSVVLVFAGILLAPISGWMIGALMVMTVFWLTYAGMRAYSVQGLLTVLALSGTLAWLVTRTLYTALDWAWKSQQRANDLLDEVRTHRAKLSRAPISTYQPMPSSVVLNANSTQHASRRRRPGDKKSSSPPILATNYGRHSISFLGSVK